MVLSKLNDDSSLILLNMKRVGWLTGPETGGRSRRKILSVRYLSKRRQDAVQGTESQAIKSTNPREGSSGLNIVDSSRCMMVYPKSNQVFLACSTLLFFVSLEFLIFNLVTITPGIISTTFSEAKCKVILKVFNGNISCHVDSIENHGKLRVFPCLQIYVTPLSTQNEELSSSNRSKRDLSSSDTLWTKSIIETTAEKAVLVQNQFSFSNKQNQRVKRNSASSNNTKSSHASVFLMYQNELSYAGLDNLYRRCSYIPKYCDHNEGAMRSEIFRFAQHHNSINSTIKCYYDNGDRVIQNKVTTTSSLVQSILWPIVGLFISVILCFIFWKRNHKHLSRLFIYNSWSAS